MASLHSDILTLVNKHLSTILEDIAAKHDLNVNDLKEQYLQTNQDIEKKKRGRKKKQKDEFIEAVEIEYDGTKYLVDDQNNVYTHDLEAPTLIGEKLVDGTIKFFKN